MFALLQKHYVVVVLDKLSTWTKWTGYVDALVVEVPEVVVLGSTLSQVRNLARDNDV